MTVYLTNDGQNYIHAFVYYVKEQTRNTRILSNSGWTFVPMREEENA